MFYVKIEVLVFLIKKIMEKKITITRSLLSAAKVSQENPFVIESLIQHLNTLTSAQLTAFYLKNKNIHSLLAEPYLDEFWHDRLIQLNPFNDDFRLTPQPLTSCREILLGYGCAMLKESTPEDWQQGLALKSYFCAKLLINNQLETIVSEESFDEQKGITLCELLESPAIQYTLHCHQAPGYLLAANTYFSLFAQCTNATFYNAYLLKAFEYLLRANDVNTQSLQAIHNNYLGEGLKSSSAYGIETIQQMIQIIKHVAIQEKNSHKPKEIELIYDQATTLAKEPLSVTMPTRDNSCTVMDYAQMDAQQYDEEGNTVLHLALLSHDFKRCGEFATSNPKLKSTTNYADLTPLALADLAGIRLPKWLRNRLSQEPIESLNIDAKPLIQHGQFCQQKEVQIIPRKEKWKAFSATI
jgi:hypothetical protein